MLGELAEGELVSLEALKQCLGGCGEDVRVFRGCRIVPPDKVTLGDHVQIDEGVKIFAGEEVRIGNHVHLAFGSSISGGGSCFIDDFAGIGTGVRIITGTDLADGSGLTNPTIPEKLRSVQRSTVRIGAHAVVFTNSVILPGVSIGEGAVIAVGSIVHHDVKPWGIYAGNPLVQVGVRPQETLERLAAELNQ